MVEWLQELAKRHFFGFLLARPLVSPGSLRCSLPLPWLSSAMLLTLLLAVPYLIFSSVCVCFNILTVCFHLKGILFENQCTRCLKEPFHGTLVFFLPFPFGSKIMYM